MVLGHSCLLLYSWLLIILGVDSLPAMSSGIGVKLILPVHEEHKRIYKLLKDSRRSSARLRGDHLRQEKANINLLICSASFSVCALANQSELVCAASYPNCNWGEQKGIGNPMQVARVEVVTEV